MSKDKYLFCFHVSFFTAPSKHFVPLSLRYTQVIALSLACRTGYQPCIDQTKLMFNRWMTTPTYTWVNSSSQCSLFPFTQIKQPLCKFIDLMLNVTMCGDFTGSTPTCAPLFTVMASQQEALQSGIMLLGSSGTPPLLVRQKSCAPPWPALSSPGCSTGMITHSSNAESCFPAACEWQPLMATHCVLLSGICSTLWMPRWSENRMPPQPSSTLPIMWSASPWLGTLWELTGDIFSQSEYNTTLILLRV